MSLHTTIEKYSHFFVVKNPTKNIYPIVYQLSSKYTQFGMKFDPFTKKQKWGPLKTFAIYVERGTEFRFHIGQFQEFMDGLLNRYVDKSSYSIIEHPIKLPEKIDVEVKEGWTLRDYQQEAHDFIVEETEGNFNSPLVMIQTGGGKLQPLDAKIKIPGGWTTMGEVKPGQTITAWDGSPTTVLEVYPHGLKEIYQVTFEDGRSTQCGLEHLWRIYFDQSEVGHVCNTAAILEVYQEHDCYIDLLQTTHQDAIEKSLASYVVRSLLNISSFDEESGDLYFQTDDETLAYRLQYHVRSLGGKASFKTISEKNYEVTVDSRSLNGKTKKLKIISIDYVGEKEAQCIAIDHPDHLYITDDFIVTHNTVTALTATATLKYRFAVIVLASYVDKWVGDITSILEIDKSEVAVIRGSDALQRCTRYPETDLPTPKAFVISISTIANWYKLYEEQKDHPSLEAYSCKPWELFSHLGIGTVIFDEVHQHPHAVYRIYTYLHAPRTISLSATLLTKDPTLQKVQAMMFPHHRRYDKLKLKRYITVHACAYQIADFIHSKVRTSEYGQNSYSHTAFEKSILKHPRLSKQYLDMIVKLVESSYIEGKMEGDKLAIFVGSAKMADAVVGALKKQFGRLDIRTYLERDPYENAIVPDIRVSTILSLGTAIDIPQLRVSIMTNSIESPIANVQTLGRLRELKDRDVRFYYLYCSTIPKHQEYHLKKIDLFSSRVKEHKQLFLRTLYP